MGGKGAPTILGRSGQIREELACYLETDWEPNMCSDQLARLEVFQEAPEVRPAEGQHWRFGHGHRDGVLSIFRLRTPTVAEKEEEEREDSGAGLGGGGVRLHEKA